MKRANDFVVGLTILVAIVIITAATLWVKQSDIGRKRAVVTARFRDVGNVRIGTQVVIRGVPSGRLQGLELSPDGWVEVRFALDPTARLPRRPVVLLNESSLFGEWQATIMEREALPHDEDVQRQIAEADRGDDVLPGATLPDIAKLTAVAGRIAGDVANVAGRVQIAFDEKAARELRTSIRNFAELSSVLAQTVRAQSQNLTTMSAGVRQGVDALVQASVNMKAVAARVDSSTERGEVKKIVQDAAEASRQLREASQRLLAISNQLGESQGRLQSFIAAGDSVMTKINRGEGSLGLMVNDPSLYRGSDSLVREMHELIADLRKNPRRYLNVRIF